LSFGANLFAVLVLLPVFVIVIIYYTITSDKKIIKILAIAGTIGVTMACMGLIKSFLNTPIKLTKAKIIGEYRIDTHFYSLKNAKWQYDHFWFKIIPADSIYFYVLDGKGRITKYVNKISWSDGPPFLWNTHVNSDFNYLKFPGNLHRGHAGFYYVYSSEKYGNMFFRKN